MVRLLSDDELNRLRRACLVAMADVAPLDCDEDAIIKASQLAFESLIEGLPQVEQTDDVEGERLMLTPEQMKAHLDAGPDGNFVNEVCPTCGETGAVTDRSGFRTCMSCDERWKQES